MRTQIDASTTFAGLVDQPYPDPRTIGSYLEQIGAPERTAQARGLRARQLARLFDAVQGHRTMHLADLVPTSVPDLVEVVHQGKNSLPLFTEFAKVFCRPDTGAAELWGYNLNRPLVSTTVGPGYFVVYPEYAGELLIDYMRIPPRRISGWPPIASNEARLGRFVYGGTQDVLRSVSDHICIGRARRGGRMLDAWFILSREPAVGN